MQLIDAHDLAASRPGKPLYAGLSVTISSGDRLAVVGINGSGKSTLLRQLAGTLTPESGTIRRGRASRVVVLDQRGLTVAGDHTARVRDAAGGGWQAEATLERLGLGGLADRPVDQLSGGQAKRVALARALVEVGEPGDGDDAVVLVLDEPTNHLDIDAIAWLEERLAAHRGALVLVTHDRHVLDRVTNRILELDRGSAFTYEGGYDAYLEGRAERAAQSAQADEVRRNLARRELAWLRRGAKARSSKAKFRVDAAHALLDAQPEAEARPGTLDLTEAARRGATTKGTGLAGYTEAARRIRSGMPRLGDKVIELDGIGHRFGDGPWLFRGVDLHIGPGERIGILGPNGAGKTTLIELITGARTPTEGTVEVGPTVVMGVHRQQGPVLDESLTVRAALAGPHRDPGPDDARLLEQFWFDNDAQHAPIALLSGGERRRLQLLLTLAERPNVLVLDEPTNDLDLDTLRVLEDHLIGWPGTVVLVSHDRTFLERTVTDVVQIDGARVARVPGGYLAWEAARVAARKDRRAGTTASTVLPESQGLRRAERRARSVAGVADPVDSGVAEASTKRSASTLRFLLKDVERDQRRLERRRDELEAKVADPETLADHEALAEAGRELGEVLASLDAVEERWLELSLEAER